MPELESLCTDPLDWFRDWPNPSVPLVAAGVYTIWDGETFIYAGMAVRSLTAEQIHAGLAASAPHAAGRRSGDKFCVYGADRFRLCGRFSSGSATRADSHRAGRFGRLLARQAMR
jgi:hypothetical protein